MLISARCIDRQVLDTLAWAERDLLLAYPQCADANVFVHLNSTSQVYFLVVHLHSCITVGCRLSLSAI